MRLIGIGRTIAIAISDPALLTINKRLQSSASIIVPALDDFSLSKSETEWLSLGVGVKDFSVGQFANSDIRQDKQANSISVVRPSQTRAAVRPNPVSHPEDIPCVTCFAESLS